MKLSDYTVAEQATQPAGRTQEHDELCAQVTDLLYAEVPSEVIARLSSYEPARARRELAALVEQVVNESDLDLGAAEQRSRVVEDTLDMVLGLGPIETLLADPTVTEVMVNGAGSVFVEREGVIEPCRERFASEEQLRLVVDRIVTPLGRRIDEQQPIVNARLPLGHRVNVVIPPISMKGTALTIRKFREQSFTLAELVRNQTMDPPMAKLIRWAVRARMNIAVCGGTGGGKTTLLNAMSFEIPHEERIVTIEDSAELRFEHPHVVQLEARMANAEGFGAVQIRDLVINSLRMRPDRIIVGECRGAEAADMLQAMLTGHDGSLTTLHANSPAEVVPRLVMMVRYGTELPTTVIEQQVAAALDLVVQQDRMQGGRRRVTQIACRKLDREAGPPREQEVFKPCVVWNRRQGAYDWLAAPSWVEELPYMGVASAEEVQAWLRELHLCS